MPLALGEKVAIFTLDQSVMPFGFDEDPKGSASEAEGKAS
jgi:hypothetical protein